MRVPRKPVCAGHSAPFEYIERAYFEPACDQVVHAPRGGGKTRLAAAATLLDLLQKPGTTIRILGGSLEQSLRMWEHLVPDLERFETELGVKLLVKKRTTTRRLMITNKSSCAVLTQSERAVRGLRVQKLRCDEVELFKPSVWEAAQLVTRSIKETAQSNAVHGAVDALSTLHEPFGLMQKIIDDASRHQTPVVKWCILDVLERCPADRSCDTCPLWEDCRGVAKERCDGFFPIDDAIRMKRRVSHETWNAEMLCRRPSVRGSVFPSFEPVVHVRHRDDLDGGEWSLSIDFGFAAPFVCLWVVSLPDGGTHVVDEYVQPQRTVTEHVRELEARPWPKSKRITCDPAGAGRSEQTATSSVDVLRRAGYVVRFRASRIADGLESIRAALKPAHGPARLTIDPRCRQLVRAMHGYRYARLNDAAFSELPVKDGQHDHLVDALRYHFVNQESRKTVRRNAY